MIRFSAMIACANDRAVPALTSTPTDTAIVESARRSLHVEAVVLVGAAVLSGVLTTVSTV